MLWNSTCKHFEDDNFCSFTVSYLQSLDLSFNNLSSIDFELTSVLRRFNPVKIHGNPWRCDSCNYPFLVTLVNLTFQREACPVSEECVMCGEPKQLRGLGIGMLHGLPPEVDPSSCVVYRSRLLSRWARKKKIVVQLVPYLFPLRWKRYTGTLVLLVTSLECSMIRMNTLFE